MHDEPDMEVSMEPEHEPEAHMISVDGPGQDDKEGDDILSLIKKMLGGEESSASPVASGQVSDYEQEGPEDSEEPSDDTETDSDDDSPADSDDADTDSDDTEDDSEDDSEETPDSSDDSDDSSEEDEEKVKEAYGQADEGNMFTGNLAKARAAGKDEADLDGDGDMEKVHEGEGMCNECGMSESMCGHSDKVDESYANEDDDKAMQDLEYMMRVISGGLNREKRDQTTLPHTSVKVSESDALAQFKRLSGI